MRNLKKFLALVLATLMVVSAMVATTVSAAEADHADAVKTLNRLNIYQGYGAGNMGADDLVTRWQMALFVARATTGFTDDSAWAGTTNTTPFTDVKADHYYGAIASAYNAGIINGVGDNKFAPEANIKYQEALAMAVRALGYTDLSYPLGYIAKAQELGLTDKLDELDNKLETAVTRGQIAEILLATIKAETKAGTIIIEDVLKYDYFDGKVVATENQSWEADVALAAKGYVTLSDGENTVSVKATELLAAGETADDLLGLPFEIATNNKWATLVSAMRADVTVKTFYNFGTEKNEITKVIQGYKPNETDRANGLKLNGKGAGVWETLSASYPKMEFYTNAVGTTAGTYQMQHYFDTDSNIVSADGKTILLYNINGTYYKNTLGTNSQLTALVVASAADIEAAKDFVLDANGEKVQFNGNYTLVKVTDAREASLNKFCEVKAFDYNNDGWWDFAVLDQYKFGKYEVKTTSSSSAVNAMNFTTDKVVNAKSQKVAYVDTIGYLAGYNGATKYNYVVADSLNVGAASGNYIVYKYNEFTGKFTLIADLGTIKTGTVTEKNGLGSYVVIDGAKYSYDLGTYYSKCVQSVGNKTMPGIVGFDDAEFINHNAIDAALVAGGKIKYLDFAGYLVYADYLDPTYGFTGFAAFTWSDMVKVDANGNLVVKAVIDTTGVKKEIAISDVDNYKVGLRIYDWLVADAKGQEDVNDKYVVGGTGTTATVVTNAKLKEALRACGGVALLPGNFYAAKKNADGTYSLKSNTTTNATTGVKLNPVDNVTAQTVTFTYGINNQSFVSDVASGDSAIATKGKFVTTSNTVYVFVAKDGIKTFQGIAPTNSTITITDTTTLYSANASCIFVVDLTRSLADICTNFNTATPTPVESDYNFYVITAATKASIVADADNKVKLVVTGLTNVITGEVDNGGIIAVDTYANLADIYAAITTDADRNGAPDASGKVIVVSAADEIFEIDEDYSALEAYLDELWKTTGGAERVDLGTIDNKNTLALAGGSRTVRSMSITTYWGLQGTVEVVDGSAKRVFGNGSTINATGNDVTFITTDSYGNVTGICFALGLTKE